LGGEKRFENDSRLKGHQSVHSSQLSPRMSNCKSMKHVTRDQLQARKEKAVRFVRDVLNDPDRAEEIADESLEDYAERRKIQITNPSKRRNAIMATTRSKADLEAEIADLKDENQELKEQLDTIADIVAPADEDAEDEDVDDEEEDDDED
jgi:hypothetical protein